MFVGRDIRFLSFLFFVALFCRESLGGFLHATELSESNMMRCVAACRVAKDITSADERVRENESQYWIGSRWKDSYGEKDEVPDVKILKVRQEDVTPFLGNKKYQSGVFITKGRQIIIAFPGADLLGNLADWAVKKNRAVHLGKDDDMDGRFSRGAFRQGEGHWGSFQLWRAFHDDILSAKFEKNPGESYSGRINKYIGDYNEKLRESGQEALENSDFQILMVGHSLGGMVAQWGAMDVLNTVYGGDNKDNNVVVVTLGAPRVFNEEAGRRWDEIMGGPDNHRNFTTARDTFWESHSGHLFTHGTGAKRQLEQDKIGGFFSGFGSWGSSGVQYHTLKEYEKAFKRDFDSRPR